MLVLLLLLLLFCLFVLRKRLTLLHRVDLSTPCNSSWPQTLVVHSTSAPQVLVL